MNRVYLCRVYLASTTDLLHNISESWAFFIKDQLLTTIYKIRVYPQADFCQLLKAPYNDTVILHLIMKA